MMDATKGLRGFLAGMDAQKSRGWAVHNELDYFTLCPRCGHWFDCRNPESLMKHQHATMANIIETIAQTSGGEICDPAIQFQNQPSPSSETPHLPPETGVAKSQLKS
ncbi:hypothetical protein V1291_005398 [Nitrobacteraceae bacterium AZCC 1564]